MSAFVSNERFKVDSLLRMAKLEGDSKKRDEYVREAKKILETVGHGQQGLSEDELRAKRKTDYAKAKLIKYLEKYGWSYASDGFTSESEIIDYFRSQFCEQNGTIREFLDKAFNELVEEKIIAVRYTRYGEPDSSWRRESLKIYICDGEAAQWYL